MGSFAFDHNESTMAVQTHGGQIDGIPAKDMIQYLSAIPGKTYITKIENLPVVSTCITWRIYGENDNFSDGTRLIADFHRHATPVNGKLQQFTMFKGFTIIPPNTNQSPPPGKYAPGSNTPIVPLAKKILTGAKATFKVNGQVIGHGLCKGFSVAGTVKKCDCGAEKEGDLESDAHSDWCSKLKKDSVS